MARLTDDADFDAGETSGNVPSPRSDDGNHDNYYDRGFRTSCDQGFLSLISVPSTCVQLPSLHVIVNSALLNKLLRITGRSGRVQHQLCMFMQSIPT
ncbi:unnamed protein product [Protopolystoma xenopodis]|uniref:Uncharacterized protein n=1 Tax=Protopolystoma xenopodis TaxID=117903 RepID=A0A448WEX8_9PLAT|nr:unnamed protein product [Protopolystoma xenopodis]